MDINVIQIGSATNEVRLGFGRQITRCVGNRKAVQHTVLMMLTTQGSDFMDPKVGGNFRTGRIENFDSGNPDSFAFDLTTRIANVQNMLLRKQAEYDGPMLSSERIQAVTLQQFRADPNRTAFGVDVLVKTADRSRTRAQLWRTL